MLDPIPRRFHKVLSPVSSSVASAFPQEGNGSASAVSREPDFRRGKDFRAADISLCSGLQVCSSPRSFLPLLYCRRAAETFTSGQNVLRYLHTHRISAFVQTPTLPASLNFSSS